MMINDPDRDVVIRQAIRCAADNDWHCADLSLHAREIITQCPEPTQHSIIKYRGRVSLGCGSCGRVLMGLLPSEHRNAHIFCHQHVHMEWLQQMATAWQLTTFCWVCKQFALPVDNPLKPVPMTDLHRWIRAEAPWRF